MFVATPEELLERGRPSCADLGFDPVDEPISWTTFGRLLLDRGDEAQGAADGPEVRRRHRQHLQRRDPLRRRPALRPRVGRAVARRRSAGSTGPWSRPCTRPSSTAGRRWPTSSTATCRASPATTRTSTRSTTARARPAGAAAGSSPRPRSAARSCTSARSARSDDGR